MMFDRVLALILGAVGFSAAGQLFLKSGATRAEGESVDFLIAAAGDRHVWAGLLAWVASTVCWLYVLHVAPLSRAYGLTSLTYLLVPAASVYLFGEELRRIHLVGMSLIVVGVWLLLVGD